MLVYNDTPLRAFKFEGVAGLRLDYLIEQNIVDEFEYTVVDMHDERPLSYDQIEDIMIYDFDFILQCLGADDFKFNVSDFNNESALTLYALAKEYNKVDELEMIINNYFDGDYPTIDRIERMLDNEFYIILNKLNIKPIDINRFELSYESKKIVDFIKKEGFMDLLEYDLLDNYCRCLPTNEEEFNYTLAEFCNNIITEYNLNYI